MSYVAVPPGDAVWGAGADALGAAITVTTNSRIRELSVSATYRLPLESPAIPRGLANWALVDKPPSPENPCVLFPAIVAISQVLATTSRTTKLLVSEIKMSPAPSTNTPLGPAN